MNAEAQTIQNWKLRRKNEKRTDYLPDLFYYDAARARRHKKCKIKTECKAGTTANRLFETYVVGGNIGVDNPIQPFCML